MGQSAEISERPKERIAVMEWDSAVGGGFRERGKEAAGRDGNEAEFTGAVFVVIVDIRIVLLLSAAAVAHGRFLLYYVCLYV